MDYIVSALAGYLTGKEEHQPRIRCHRVAISIAIAFAVVHSASDFIRSEGWDVNRIGNNLLFTAVVYAFSFLVLKWWDRSRKRRSRSSSD